MEVVMKELSNITNFMAFAFGSAIDTYVGLAIEEKLSTGMVILRIITTEKSNEEIVSLCNRKATVSHPLMLPASAEMSK